MQPNSDYLDALYRRECEAVAGKLAATQEGRAALRLIAGQAARPYPVETGQLYGMSIAYTARIIAGGKPKPGTPPDKRLKENKPKQPKKGPFPGAAPPFGGKKKGK